MIEAFTLLPSTGICPPYYRPGMLSKLSKWSGTFFSKVTKLPVARMGHQSSNSASPLKAGHLVKPLVFTFSVCGSSFVVATVCQYENRKKDFKYSLFGNSLYKLNNRNRKSNDHFLVSWWNSQTAGFQVFLALAFLNGLVFLGWRVPRLYNFMNRYFVSSIETKSIRCLPMVFSNFSHYSPFHLGLNMMVLYSFSNIGVHLFGKENFLALYLSSGVVSTFASYAYKVAVCSLAPSIGASGAILGILASTCIEQPDIKLMIIFLPFFSFSSATALKGLILIDSLGLILRWGFFDHAAHLGGTLFGVYYSYELKRQINKNQTTIIKHWNDLKQMF